jgi:hypothetical protein
MKGLGRCYLRGSVYWIEYWHRGKGYRESSHSDKDTVAKRLLKKRLGEIGSGQFIGPTEEKVTFEEMVSDLLNHYRANEQDAEAVKYPIARLRKSFGFDKAIDITTDRIRLHIAKSQEAGAANGTINRDLAALKRMFSLALQANKLSRKPHIPTLEETTRGKAFSITEAFLLFERPCRIT